MRRGQCVTCGKTKTQFIKNDATGGSFLNSLVNKLPFEMHLPGHNFTGPGTKLLFIIGLITWVGRLTLLIYTCRNVNFLDYKY